MATYSEEINIKLFDMVLCLSRAIDLLHPTISDHHFRVAYISACLAEELGSAIKETQDVLIAGALHDVAAVSSEVGIALLDFALTHSQLSNARSLEGLHKHGHEGYLLLRDFPPFAEAASIIRFHHVDWNFGQDSEFAPEIPPIGSHILRLADRIAVLPNPHRNILEQVPDIREKVKAGAGRQFNPDIIAAFEALAARESFWLDLISPHKGEIIKSRFGDPKISLTLDELYELARVFARIIDYRSPFTATHSSGVAAAAEALAARLGIGQRQTKLIAVAGYLHDIGKLAVPPEILDKPGKLTLEEMLIIKQHPYYTHSILSMVPGLETVNTWASLHHERLDGAGYPFRRRDIPLGARIIAVADVFTATTEDRPYRKGMERAQCLALLDRLVDEGAIDGEIVNVLRSDFEELYRIRSLAQESSIGTSEGATRSTIARSQFRIVQPISAVAAKSYS